jgi:hypothetical protein
MDLVLHLGVDRCFFSSFAGVCKNRRGWDEDRNIGWAVPALALGIGVGVGLDDSQRSLKVVWIALR